MKREEVLDKAKALVNGAREKEYAPPKKNFQRIANMWKEILGTDVSPEEVALCMIAVKITRLIESPSHEDSWVDLAGYAACGSEVVEKEDVTPNSLKGFGWTPAKVEDFNFWGVHNG